MFETRNSIRRPAFTLSAWGLSLPVVVSFIAGCGGGNPLDTIPVGGRVTMDGKPLTTGEVRYLPKDAQNGRVASGAIQPDGSFALTTLKAEDGALRGDYRVVVVVYKHQMEDIFHQILKQRTR